MRWHLLDEVLEIRKGVSAHARSRVPVCEFSPEVLLIEMMAQTGALVMGAENHFKEDVVFAKIQDARFPAIPVLGESIEISASADGLRPEGSWMEGSVRNSHGVLASARILLIHPASLVPEKNESTTFHPAFMNHFKILEKIK